MSENDTPAKPARKPRKTAAKATKKAAGKGTGAESQPRDAKPPRSRAKRATPDTATPRTSAAAEPPTPSAARDDASTVTTAGPPSLIRVPMPVRWRDLDAFNHVNNSKYLSYLEEARLHWMIGLPGQGMDEHVAPVVAAAQLNYRRPIAWPAQVVVELFVERLGNTSLTVGHRIVDAGDGSVLYCDGHVVMVWIDRDSGSAAALPAAVREACTD